MRLTCPNCGAQYEVPDDVIPEEGRDVQCSNCGDTWFQHAAGYDPQADAAAQNPDPAAVSSPSDPSVEAPQMQDAEVEIGSAPDSEFAQTAGTEQGSDAELAQGDQRDAPSQAPSDPLAGRPAAPPKEPDTEPRADDTGPFADADAEATQRAREFHEGAATAPPAADIDRTPEAPQQSDHRPATARSATRDGAGFADTHADTPVEQGDKAAPQPRGLDPALSGILREEAEREANLRATAAPQGLETQPGLGLDDLPEDENARRTRQAKDRMARIRGEDPRRLAAEASGLKRGVLPDIEEINSTLRANDAAPHPAPDLSAPAPRKSGFTRGFALAILVIVAMVMVYSNAPQIAEQVPQADPYLSSYVTWVDQARLWLDTQVKALQAPQF